MLNFMVTTVLGDVAGDEVSGDVYEAESLEALLEELAEDLGGCWDDIEETDDGSWSVFDDDQMHYIKLV